MTLLGLCFTAKRRALLLVLCSLGLVGAFHTIPTRPTVAYDWCSRGCHRQSHSPTTSLTSAVAVQNGFVAG